MFDALPGLEPLTGKSPMPYPGGKYKGRHKIKAEFPRGVKTMLSPFCGGAHLELCCAKDGIRVYCYDIYADLIKSFKHMQGDPQRFYEEAITHIPGDSIEFKALKQYYTTITDPFERSCVFYVVHKYSFSGLGFSGGSSPWKISKFHKNSRSVKAVKHFHNPLISFDCLPFEESLDKHKDIFAYLDPPYLLDYCNNLYGKDGQLHKSFNHNLLWEILRSRSAPWCLSYNDSEEVKRMYNGYRFAFPSWHWSITKNARHESQEILIMNY